MFGPSPPFRLSRFSDPEIPLPLVTPPGPPGGRSGRRPGVTPAARSKGRWGSAHPTSETCFWAWRRSKKPLELSCDRYREPDQGAGVVPTPPARRVSGPGVARKSRWSLAFTVTDKQSKALG
ncbi:hypothetical protein G5714_024689 [Onychostoma macrolepis]|uniref:Uncharacterized protein n=1 Tax=Onychostoma macrolepis TaxID=369639 RepID=A0A7J6BHJ2_9TELE|nr:hypothetical protein G5714_024689 [Onychostoma macrolepis]